MKARVGVLEDKKKIGLLLTSCETQGREKIVALSNIADKARSWEVPEDFCLKTHLTLVCKMNSKPSFFLPLPIMVFLGEHL